MLKPLLDQQAKRVADWAKEMEAFKADEPERIAKHAEDVKRAKAAGRRRSEIEAKKVAERSAARAALSNRGVRLRPPFSCPLKQL